MTDITARKSEDDRIRDLAFHDPVTLLPDPGLLLDRADAAMYRGKRAGKNQVCSREPNAGTEHPERRRSPGGGEPRP